MSAESYDVEFGGTEQEEIDFQVPEEDGLVDAAVLFQT